MDVVVPEEYKPLYVRDAERPVYKVPDPVLRQTAKPVTKVAKRHQHLINDMVRIMKAANGQGLAAPQIGVLERIVIIAPGGSKAIPLINPEIVEATGEQIGQEGCLSIPGLYGDVKRAKRVVVRAYDRNGRGVEYEMEGLPARVIQHEVDHLDGILFIDKVDPATLFWQDPNGEDDE